MPNKHPGLARSLRAITSAHGPATADAAATDARRAAEAAPHVPDLPALGKNSRSPSLR